MDIILESNRIKCVINAYIKIAVVVIVSAVRFWLKEPRTKISKRFDCFTSPEIISNTKTLICFPRLNDTHLDSKATSYRHFLLYAVFHSIPNRSNNSLTRRPPICFVVFLSVVSLSLRLLSLLFSSDSPRPDNHRQSILISVLWWTRPRFLFNTLLALGRWFWFPIFVLTYGSIQHWSILYFSLDTSSRIILKTFITLSFLFNRRDMRNFSEKFQLVYFSKTDRVLRFTQNITLVIHRLYHIFNNTPFKHPRLSSFWIT